MASIKRKEKEELRFIIYLKKISCLSFKKSEDSRNFSNGNGRTCKAVDIFKNYIFSTPSGEKDFVIKEFLIQKY